MNVTTKIIAVKQETHDTTTLILQKPEGFTYSAGQYAMVGFADEHQTYGKSTIPLTFSSSPLDDEIHFTLKNSGGFSSELSKLQADDNIFFRGPAGDAYNVDSSMQENLVLIAGGTGITPYRSIIRYILTKNMKNKIILLNGNKTEADIIFKEELDNYNKINQITVINTLEQPPQEWQGEVGFINKHMIENYVDDINKYTYMVCGGPRMVASIKAVLAELGVPEEQVKIDPWELPGKKEKETRN